MLQTDLINRKIVFAASVMKYPIRVAKGELQGAELYAMNVWSFLDSYLRLV